MDWDLIGWSFRMIRRNPRFAIFPVLSGGTALAAICVFALFRYGGLDAVVSRASFGWDDYVWGVAALFLVSFIVLFFNCALAACVNASLRGEEDVTIGYGLEFATARLPRILAWSLLATSIGLVLDAIERRVSVLGKVTTWIFGFAWAMATYLVVPVLIAEDLGAFGSVRRASELARRVWGKQVVAEIRFGWRTLLFFLPAVVLFALAMNGYPLVLPVAVVYTAVCLTALSAARGIFEVALYRYAAHGETPREWSAKMRSALR